MQFFCWRPNTVCSTWKFSLNTQRILKNMGSMESTLRDEHVGSSFATIRSCIATQQHPEVAPWVLSSRVAMKSQVVDAFCASVALVGWRMEFMRTIFKKYWTSMQLCLWHLLDPRETLFFLSFDFAQNLATSLLLSPSHLHALIPWPQPPENSKGTSSLSLFLSCCIYVSLSISFSIPLSWSLPQSLSDWVIWDPPWMSPYPGIIPPAFLESCNAIIKIPTLSDPFPSRGQPMIKLGSILEPQFGLAVPPTLATIVEHLRLRRPPTDLPLHYRDSLCSGSRDEPELIHLGS